MKFRSSEVLILMMLAGGERYANEMVKLFARRRVQTHGSTVHYVLCRLVRQKLVATRWLPSKNGVRKEELRYYRLTGRGQTELQRYLALFDGFRPSRSISSQSLQQVSGL